MKLLIDNTGLHATGRCLDGDAKGQLDVLGLLQTATQIVFSESLTWSGLGQEWAEKRGQEVITTLVHAGAPEALFQSATPTDEIFKAACTSAANRLAQELNYAIKSKADVSLVRSDEQFPEWPNAKNEEVRRIGQIVNEEIRDTTDYDALMGIGLTARASCLYMLGASGDLRHALKTAKGHSGLRLTPEEVVVYMRYYLNQELATGEGAVYAPAVSRAMFVHDRSANILDLVQRAVNSAVAGLREDTQIPAIGDALAKRSKGDPHGLIHEAAKARESAGDIRAFLADLSDSGELADDRKVLKINQEMEKLRRELVKQLSGDEPPSIARAFEFDLMGLIPIPKFGEIVQWIKHRQTQRKISVLSEFAMTAANQNRDHYSFDMLLTRCCPIVRPD